MNRYFKVIIGIGISVFFLWYVLKDVHFDLLLEYLGSFNLLVLVAGLVIWLVGYGIRGWRWQLLLRPVVQVPFMTSFKVLVIGFTANNLLPLRAGEFVRAYLLGKKLAVPKTTVFATVAAERLFDGIIVLLFTLIGATSVELIAWMRQSMWVAGSIFLIVLVGFAFFLILPDTAFGITKFCLRIFPENIRTRLLSLIEVFVQGIQFLRHPDLLVLVTLSSVAIWLTEAAFYYIAAISFGISISFTQALFIKGILNLGILLPSAPGYVGTFEFFIVETMKLMKVDQTKALGYALVSHFVEFVSINVVGVYYMFREGLHLDSKGQVLESSKNGNG